MRANGAGGSGSLAVAFVRAAAGRAAVPAIVVCGMLAPLAFHWLSGRTLVWFDTARLYAPQRWLVDEALRSFRLPLWNPFMGGGMPFFADAIHGVLHPVSILTAWLGTDRSADVLIGGYVACAGLGAAVLARELGASRSASAAAAFAFGMSGFVLSMAGNLVFLAGASSLPFCVAGLRRFAVDPRPASLAFGVVGVAMLALSGDAQSLVVGGALSLALAWEAAGWRGAARAVAAGAVGLLLAGVQLVPSAVNVLRSDRVEGTWSPMPTVWPFEPWRIPELVLPGLLWGPSPLLDPLYAELAGRGHWVAGQLPHPFSASVCVGLMPVALATVGIRSSRRGKLLGALALAIVWIALGPALGASAVLGHVPIWRTFRYSEKLVGPLTLVLAVLAALGTDALGERRVGGRWMLAVAGALGLAAIGACWVEASRLPPDLASVMARPRLARGSLHVLGAALALGVWVRARDRLGPSGARAALAGLAWAGMAAAAPAALRPGDPAARLRAPGPALAADTAPVPRILTPYTYEPIPVDPGLAWIDQAAREHASKGYVAYNVRSRLDSFDHYEAMAPRRLALMYVAYGPRWVTVARRYAVTHVIVDAPRSEGHRSLYGIATSGGTRVGSFPGDHEVWAVPHREWASFAPEVRVVDGERSAVLATAGAFVAQSPAVVVESSGRFGVAPGRVLSIDRGLESVRIEAEADGDATLVIADAWWPGWRATIDGHSEPIFQADLLVRAVRWPAGRHVLEMRYRPPEVELGLLVSVLGVAALVVWIAVLSRRAAATRAVPSAAAREAAR